MRMKRSVDTIRYLARDVDISEFLSHLLKCLYLQLIQARGSLRSHRRTVVVAIRYRNKLRETLFNGIVGRSR
jgi:hypothetical protein